MAKKRKTKNKKFNKSENIGDNIVQEEIIEISKETFAGENKAKKIAQIGEKVQAVPQTYVEDTFNLDDQKNEQTIIENTITKKVRKVITKDELYGLYTFQNKITKIKAKVENQKSFNFLLDFVTASKLYKTYDITDGLDEFDYILEEIVLNFRKRLARIKLSYNDYKLIEEYFENLKSLYRDFKNKELVETEILKERLNKTVGMNDFISYHLF